MSGARLLHPGQHGAVFGFAGWSGSGSEYCYSRHSTAGVGCARQPTWVPTTAIIAVVVVALRR